MWLTIVSLPFLLMSAFVANNTSFPKPLSSEEEDRYLRLYSIGDEKAKNILIEKNLRLVAHVVKKYHNTGYNADDLISIGTIGLIKAITTFDTSKGTRLATYAARCIENEILMTIRAGKKTKNEVSIQEPIGIDKEGNELSLIVYRRKSKGVCGTLLSAMCVVRSAGCRVILLGC